MKKLITFLTVIILILSYSCNNPEKSFEKALNTRQKEDFHKVVKKYPDSEYSTLASEKIIDLEFWSKIDSSLRSKDYETYLDSFPNALFNKKAKLRIEEINDFTFARKIDIIESYTKYQENYPSSIFIDSISDRIEFLKPIFKRFQIITDSHNISAYKSFVREYQETGYGKIITNQLDSIFLKNAEEEVLSMNQYKELPNNIDSLMIFMETTKNIQKSNRAKQAYEAILVKIFQNKDTGFKYIIPKVSIKPSELTFKYSIKKSSKTGDVSAKLAKAFFVQVTISGTLTTFEIDDLTYLLFTENNDDLIPYNYGSQYSSDILTGLKGEMSSWGLDKRSKYFYENTVWRFYGGKITCFDHEINSEENEPLCFYLKKGIGAVYFYGKGTIIYEGVETKLGY